MFPAFICFIFFADANAEKFDHSLYDSLLRENVSGGLVDYENIKDDPSSLLKYLNLLETLDSTEYEAWDDPEKIAFWINAYNAITIYAVVQNYPIKKGGLFSRLIFPDNSLRQISNFWKTVFVPIMGKEVTLDDIEHEILRKKFSEPRIHFTLVCASLGCPELQPFAFDPDSLELQLERSAIGFLDSKGAVLDSGNNILRVSKIFQWYGKDFHYNETPRYLDDYDKDKRGFLNFIIEHSDSDFKNYFIENHPDIQFSKYDWTLNERR